MGTSKDAVQVIRRSRPNVMVKTTTLGDEDQPTVTILEGHHDLETFNRAFVAEGWDSGGWDPELVSHEYWIPHEDGTWSSSTKHNPKAVPVTVGDW